MKIQLLGALENVYKNSTCCHPFDYEVLSNNCQG